MSAPGAMLQGFAYGEHLEGPQKRSLGFRLLAPLEQAAWCAEVENLARRLQAAPYPDHWPPTDLFCSTLLADGRRIIAVARYGLADHTPSQRRGGLELIGVVGPGSMGVSSSLAIYKWLQDRRSNIELLNTLGGQYPLEEVLSAVPPVSSPAGPVPVLPIRLWQEGALLFAATAPSDPDHALGLLEQGPSAAWQWLPLVGADFPIQSYAQRGPLVAWTPHLAGVALKLDRKPTEDSPPARRRGLRSALVPGIIVLLLAGNLWATLSIPRLVKPPVQEIPASPPTPPAAQPVPALSSDTSAEQFVQALDHVLHPHGETPEWSQSQLTKEYERALDKDRDLRIASPRGRQVVGEISLLSRRNVEGIRALMHKALDNKGYDPTLIDLACQRVYNDLTADTPEQR